MTPRLSELIQLIDPETTDAEAEAILAAGMPEDEGVVQ